MSSRHCAMRTALSRQSGPNLLAQSASSETTLADTSCPLRSRLRSGGGSAGLSEDSRRHQSSAAAEGIPPEEDNVEAARGSEVPGPVAAGYSDSVARSDEAPFPSIRALRGYYCKLCLLFKGGHVTRTLCLPWTALHSSFSKYLIRTKHSSSGRNSAIKDAADEVPLPSWLPGSLFW